MLTQKQIDEIKEHLEKAQNPVFFFDNDPDGLCSFLLLQRYIERGKGVVIKSAPNLTVDYFRKVNELNADYVFILDKPEVSEEFFEECHKINIPVVWIDHHETTTKVPKFANYYNPLLNDGGSYIPTSFLCYQVTGKKEDMWIAVIGCISDWHVPDFYSDFEKKYPDLGIESKKMPEIYYESQLGKIAQLMNAGLKDRTTNVIRMLKFLMKVKTPYGVLEESKNNRLMHKRFNYIDGKQRKLIEKAKKVVDDGRVLFFEYGGELSISTDLANELKYLYPDKIIVVAYDTGVKVNISLRGKNVREKLLKVIEGFENATGGGHEEAVGAKIKSEDLGLFRERLLALTRED
ncbi:DHH family phosphoesterase [Candidatus Pacearchaeota archaeon]|nr:DHH family phosphoesterase [Candidatus Pacearchaeota archaeon]